MATVQLKPGREKSVLRRHPWIFSGSVFKVKDSGSPIQLGETVDVLDSQGNFLARGAYSPHSQIRVRIWSWDPEETIGPDFFARKLEHAIVLREAVIDPERTDAFRLVYAESDGLPGLIVDRYAGTLVMQPLSAGIEYWRDTFVELLCELTGLERIFERGDVEVRALEGLPERKGVLIGPEPPALLRIHEHGLEFWVDVQAGHKTGFYLDQRENRRRVRALAVGKAVLDCFSYTGGFSLSALAGGALSVVAVDSSKDSLELAEKNLALNDRLAAGRVDFLEGDVFKVLREYRDHGRSFDLIVLDPPKFAPTAAQAQRAARGYKDINLLAFKLLNPGGTLVTFSCSGGISEELFQKIVAGAALDAGADAEILERLHQGPDHPVALNFPEAAYLKGFVIHRVG
jgi:23S rRNA (cytosine1962-C5)-methyltransferase